MVAGCAARPTLRNPHGAEARRVLINWIQAKHVPFTPAELAAFNARKQSKATFVPN
jgi:hypothetical protein